MFLLSQLLESPGLISLNKIPADKNWFMSQTLSDCFPTSSLIVFNTNDDQQLSKLLGFQYQL